MSQPASPRAGPSLFVGIPWVLFLWGTGIRKPPKIGRRAALHLRAVSLPFAVYYEGASFASQWAASTAKVGSFWLTRQMALDGLYYYVSLITHSIASTIKRVCIILATVLVFGNKLTPIGAAGSAIAVAGTFLYCIRSQSRSTREQL
ncbi:hypothetical protein EMIHUDRAFT_212920 [Emiliania huxleyi CCMP1516]|uniref:Sugar phosphate transporter domain-containing protein n=2 Tax=Emiliania huxleyi TaxID=2903 RepID=A0A0D3IPI0_EMIH1|nr:hypothetical protein EMIHUDRAFT_212920 [Emiliania huxleyi CCMP1516]EOD13165.1 hypothetical protein EMIHUDRAFT_212920 [Emiliania huxleyi CCMP1516]|eukprot:XP_005765594.1 hypothetical protein EMIHUDRAFT_212920 [Emiliania huxleyi CCMP1516]